VGAHHDGSKVGVPSGRIRDLRHQSYATDSTRSSISLAEVSEIL